MPVETLIADRTERLDQFLARMRPERSRTRWSEWVEAGHVHVAGEPAKPSTTLRAGVEVQILRAIEDRATHDLKPADIPLSILFEDEHLLLVDKPRGLATHPAASLNEPSLVNALLARGQALSAGTEPWRPGIVHRLDKETTGLLLVAKTDAAHVGLARQIETRQAKRDYLAWVAGEVERTEWRIEAPIGRDPRNRQRMAVVPSGKPAATRVRLIRTWGGLSLLELGLETGRTHQIRVHLSAIGFPVLGDDLYAPGKWKQGPLQLHAYRIRFRHPATGEEIEVEAPPPADFLAP